MSVVCSAHMHIYRRMCHNYKCFLGCSDFSYLIMQTMWWLYIKFYYIFLNSVFPFWSGAQKGYFYKFSRGVKTESFCLSANPLKNYKKFTQTLLKRGRKTITFPLLILNVEVFGFWRFFRCTYGFELSLNVCILYSNWIEFLWKLNSFFSTCLELWSQTLPKFLKIKKNTF